MNNRRIFKIKSKTVLNRVTTPAMPFTWSINPYRGCSHGCAFCYARNTHSFLGMGTDDTFRTHLFVKEDAPEVLRRELAKGRWRGGRVAIGTATDPYQPLEKQRGLTRRILEILVQYRIPTTITTRSPLIIRDLDLLQELSSRTECSVNISINTLDVRIWRSMEPESPHPQARFATVRKLREAGIRAGIFLAPVLPFLTDDESTLDRLLQHAKESDASFVFASLLRLKPEVKPWFFAQLERHYSNLISCYRSLYKGTYAEEQFAQRFHEKVAPLLEQWGFAKESLSITNSRSDWKCLKEEQLSFAL
ncbi:SPL family radical SAM protein [Effusibacillus lacus]|uniref:SPL family radical SAM protein n=1 Tax=Effusibacillus lacus TaxID=1348429 RepID=UPI000BB737CA|nr:radical SAM protein [Effusibacillus lacus]TCS72334.1 DNA repair photolyase [Effusibacillus lacus]